MPEELSRSNERHWVLEFPSHYIVPLVQFERKVAMGTDLVGEVGIHGTFGGRTDCYRLLKVALATEITVNATTYYLGYW